MKFIVLIYNDPEMLAKVPPTAFNSTMRDCITHADDMQYRGRLHQSEMLEDPSTARTFRIRKGKKTVLDGPFTETKEVLGGFNIIEAVDMDDAMRIAEEFPWAELGAIEVRPIREINTVRRAVGLPERHRREPDPDAIEDLRR